MQGNAVQRDLLPAEAAPESRGTSHRRPQDSAQGAFAHSHEEEATYRRMHFPSTGLLDPAQTPLQSCDLTVRHFAMPTPGWIPDSKLLRWNPLVSAQTLHCLLCEALGEPDCNLAAGLP